LVKIIFRSFQRFFSLALRSNIGILRPMTERAWVQNSGGVRLRELLDESKEEQAALERRLGLKPGYVSDAIRGKARPNYTKRARFSAEMGIPLDLWDVDIVTKEGATS
jgi:hypothetical protein